MIFSEEYKKKFKDLTGDEKMDMYLYEKAKTILEHRNNTELEDMYLFNVEKGLFTGVQTHSNEPEHVVYN